MTMHSREDMTTRKVVQFVIDYAFPILVFLTLIILVLHWIDTNPAGAHSDLPEQTSARHHLVPNDAVSHSYAHADHHQTGAARHEIDAHRGEIIQHRITPSTFAPIVKHFMSCF